MSHTIVSLNDHFEDFEPDQDYCVVIMNIRCKSISRGYSYFQQ